jgi:RNA polymerase sigma-70 factor (ECF subfamily)
VIDGTTTAEGLDRLRAAYDAHAAPLLRMAVALTADRTLAEDLVHDAFVRLHRAADPPPPDAERAYLRRIVTNLVVDHHRHGSVVRRHAPAPVAPAASVEAHVEASDRARAVAAAVAALPDRQRDCVTLHYFAGLSDAAVAAELGISVGSVKTHLHRARAALALSLEDQR